MSTLSVNNIDGLVNLSSNSFTVGNSSVNATINSTSLSVTNIAVNGNINTTSISVGNTVVNTTLLSTSSIAVGANVSVNTSTVSVGNSSVNARISSTALTVGANVSVNTSTIFIGNSSLKTIITSNSITTDSITATRLYQPNVAQFSWDSATSSPAKIDSGLIQTLTTAHTGMRRCVMHANGTVNYYLSATDSTKKADGSNSTLTGADGNVMVEIPKFYTKREVNGTVTTWYLSDTPLSGFSLHPAFRKNGVEVNYRYMSAYDGCVNTTGSTYQSGLNWDDNVGVNRNWNTATAKLASVSGIYPATGITRAEARSMARNVGTGWRVADFWLIQAIQYLYLTEYGTYYSQQQLGDGNTAGSYAVPSSGNQTDSPHSIAGKSNSLGNSSTNSTTGASSGTRDTAFMSYRGIENWYGNIWYWVDGFNINNYIAYVSNTDTTFDDTSTTTNNYSQLTTVPSSGDGYPINHQNIENAWIPSAVGGSTSTYWTDYYFRPTSTGAFVALFGGAAADGGGAGGFFWALSTGAAAVSRPFGARLAF